MHLADEIFMISVSVVIEASLIFFTVEELKSP
jgi:hypothetical protein